MYHKNLIKHMTKFINLSFFLTTETLAFLAVWAAICSLFFFSFTLGLSIIKCTKNPTVAQGWQ